MGAGGVGSAGGGEQDKAQQTTNTSDERQTMTKAPLSGKTPEKTNRKPLLNSSTKFENPNKLAPERKSKATPKKKLPFGISIVKITTPSGRVVKQRYFRPKPVKPSKVAIPTSTCTSCCNCNGLPAGGAWTCEDDVGVYVEKPVYFAVWANDPNTGLPFWCRPVDLGL